MTTTLQQLKLIVASKQRMMETLEKLRQCGFNTDGAIFETIYRYQDHLENVIDPDGWIAWFCEANGGKVEIHGVKYDVVTVEKLHELFFSDKTETP